MTIRYELICVLTLLSFVVIVEGFPSHHRQHHHHPPTKSTIKREETTGITESSTNQATSSVEFSQTSVVSDFSTNGHSASEQTSTLFSSTGDSHANETQSTISYVSTTTSNFSSTTAAVETESTVESSTAVTDQSSQATTESQSKESTTGQQTGTSDQTTSETQAAETSTSTVAQTQSERLTTAQKTLPPCLFDCSNKQDGDYSDPNNPCNSTFYTCSNQFCYQMHCPSSLVFDQAIDSCVYQKDLPVCNSSTAASV